MRLASRVTALTLLALTAPSLAAAQAAQASSLSWLVGCLERTTRTGRAYENWTSVGAELLGTARVVNDSSDRETERLRIFVRGDTLIYEAHPNTQALTEFQLRSQSGDSVVFENAAHDFPQRITYWRLGRDSVIAVAGNISGTARPLRFPFRRVDSCPAPSAASVNEARVRALLQVRYDSLVVRERRAQGELSAWFVDNSEAGFVMRAWASAGWTVPVVNRAAYARNAEAFRNQTNRPVLRDRRYTVTLDRMQIRGDTADVHLTTKHSWFFTDVTGAFGEPGKERQRATEDRRIDTWVQADGAWRLRQAALVASQVAIDGRVTLRNGERVR